MAHRFAFLAIAAIAFVVSCARPLPPEEPLAVSPVSMGPGEQRAATNVFVLTDASGTMYGNETFPKAKALSESLVMALPPHSARSASPEYNVATIGFGGDERVETRLPGFDRNEARSSVRGLELLGSKDGMGGTTPLHQVLGEIGTQLEGRRGATAVILFTDGLPDNPEAALEVASLLAEGRGSDLCFHTVQLGDDPVGSVFLRDFAATTPCGSVRKASAIDDIASFERFAKGAVVGGAGPPAVAAPAASPCGTIRLRGIEFGFDSASIDEGGAAVLDAAAALLDECTSVGVKVDGHTDSTGPETYNQGLSERRAGAVKQYLSREGVDAGRLATEGFGESRPIAPNDTREGRARNRRVELNPR